MNAWITIKVVVIKQIIICINYVLRFFISMFFNLTLNNFLTKQDKKKVYDFFDDKEIDKMVLTFQHMKLFSCLYSM